MKNTNNKKGFDCNGNPKRFLFTIDKIDIYCDYDKSPNEKMLFVKYKKTFNLNPKNELLKTYSQGTIRYVPSCWAQQLKTEGVVDIINLAGEPYD